MTREQVRFKETKIEGLYVIELESKSDERGSFARIFDVEEFKKAGIDFRIVQASQSVTLKKGTLRGMHFQREPRVEVKLIRCLRGRVYDVAVDMRAGSPTYLKWHAEELSPENGKMFFLPKGMAHGFVTFTDDCAMEYFMDEIYAPEYASGIRWNDPAVGILWPIREPILGEKDQNWPLI